MTRIHRRDVVKGIGASALAMSTPWYARAQDTPKRGGTLKVGIVLDNTKTMDPMLSINPDERQVLFLAYNTLVAIRPDLTIEPELATSWKIENDGRRYVFNLREGVKFQDGTPFDAEAVKWNISKRLDEATKSPQRQILGPVIASIEVVAPHVIAFNLNYQYPALLGDFADRPGFMVSPTASAKFGADYGRNPVGTGPYTLKRWAQGSVISLARNPDYWLKDRTYLDNIEFITLPNQAIGLQRVNIGEIDHLDRLGPAELRQVDKSRGVVVHRQPTGRWYALQWQVDRPPFNNPKLRQAIAHAINRDRINEIILDGQGKVANGVMQHEGLWFSNPPKVKLEHSQSKAKELLKEAGWSMDDTLTLSAPSEAYYSKISQLVAEQIQQIGMKVTLQPVPQSEYYGRVVQRLINFAPTAWTVRPDPDTVFYFLLHTKGAGNTTGYSSPETDRLLEAARKTLDQAERRRLYGEVEANVMTDLPYIPLYFGADFLAVSGKLGGFTPMPDHVPRFRYVWKNA